jgi:hypothetical protein
MSVIMKRLNKSALTCAMVIPGDNADLCSVLHRQLSPIRPSMMRVVGRGSRPFDFDANTGGVLVALLIIVVVFAAGIMGGHFLG